MLGCLEMRHVVPAEADQFRFSCRLSLTQGNEGAGHFAPFVIRLGDDSNVQNGGMFVEDRFDLDGRNILATGNNDVL